MSITESDAASDIVWGAEEIGRVINRPPRVVFHMLTNGALPAKKVGGRWVASRKRLRTAVLGDEPGLEP